MTVLPPGPLPSPSPSPPPPPWRSSSHGPPKSKIIPSPESNLQQKHRDPPTLQMLESSNPDLSFRIIVFAFINTVLGAVMVPPTHRAGGVQLVS